MVTARSIHCDILCDIIISESDLGQRHKGELVHLQLRLLSTLSAQLTLQYTSSRHSGNTHPYTSKTGRLLALDSCSPRGGTGGDCA